MIESKVLATSTSSNAVHTKITASSTSVILPTRVRRRQKACPPLPSCPDVLTHRAPSRPYRSTHPHRIRLQSRRRIHLFTRRLKREGFQPPSVLQMIPAITHPATHPRTADSPAGAFRGSAPHPFQPPWAPKVRILPNSERTAGQLDRKFHSTQSLTKEQLPMDQIALHRYAASLHELPPPQPDHLPARTSAPRPPWCCSIPALSYAAEELSIHDSLDLSFQPARSPSRTSTAKSSTTSTAWTSASGF